MPAGQLETAREYMAAVGAQRLGVGGWRENSQLAHTWMQLNGSCREAYRLDLALQLHMPDSLKAFPREQLANTYLAEVCFQESLTLH